MSASTMAEALQTIGDNLRKLREQKQLTQEQVGEKAKLSRNTVARYEAGEIARFAELGEICAALGVPWSEVFPGDVFAKLNVGQLDGDAESKAPGRPVFRHIDEDTTKVFITDIPIEYDYEKILSEVPENVRRSVMDFHSVPPGSQALLLAKVLQGLPEIERDRSLAVIDAFTQGLRSLSTSLSTASIRIREEEGGITFSTPTGAQVKLKYRSAADEQRAEHPEGEGVIMHETLQRWEPLDTTKKKP